VKSGFLRQPPTARSRIVPTHAHHWSVIARLHLGSFGPVHFLESFSTAAADRAGFFCSRDIARSLNEGAELPERQLGLTRCMGPSLRRVSDPIWKVPLPRSTNSNSVPSMTSRAEFILLGGIRFRSASRSEGSEKDGNQQSSYGFHTIPGV
jgi:hypothetical protein